LHTFKKGIHPPYNKDITKDSAIKVMPVKDVTIPLLQHIGKVCEPVVKEGDYVKAAQLIGTSDKGMYSNIYSSVSGFVKGIKDIATVNGQKCPHVVIENDYKDNKILLLPLSEPTPEQILQRIKEAGIVGMGGAGFPTHIKLNPPKTKTIDTLIINGSECEPYITCDYRLMIEHAAEVAEGARLLGKVLNVKKIYIGIEDNKPAAIKALSGYRDIEVVPLKTKYPQGAEKQLIYAITKRTVPLCRLPMDVGCVNDNVHTAYSVYHAVYSGIPCYERVVTISGRAADITGNFIIKTGTPLSYISEFCGMKEQPAKIIFGGPMMGVSQYNMDVAVSKTTSSILFLTENEINNHPAGPCINCGRCARVCPMNLMPMFIDAYTLVGDFKNAKKYGAEACIECGCCAYTCPTKRPLVQSIRLAKKIVREKNI
jgi:electron transport complex protein RnfC